ncbi:MAG: hypothetical protein CL889_03155 [Dehalococcoidia bacterium]|nr:hypothetical protein [Dehalococcoidia bacterium]
MGEDRMNKPHLTKEAERKYFVDNPDAPIDNLEKEWYRDYDYVVKTFASSGIPTKKSKLTKQGWYDAWLEMVSLCARALEYNAEANRRAKNLEDELQTTNKKIIETADEYKKMVKSFDELGEKYTKDMDALMKLLLLLGRKIDE